MLYNREMAHHTLRDGYTHLAERLNRFPQGAPPTELLFRILRMLLSEKEAELVSLLPIKPFNAQKASKAWRRPLAETERILEDLASRALLLDIGGEDPQYVLPPPMAGFFEFSLMRTRGDLNQRALSQLFHAYVTVEEDFIRDLLVSETPVGRAFVQESAIPDSSLFVLDYERASSVIKTASHIGVGLCYCRHKLQHLGKACQAPLEICLTFGPTAASLAKHGHARLVEAAEGLSLLDQAQSHGLVQFGENVREGVTFLCNCCGCCCEALTGARRFGSMRTIQTTNFLPRIEKSCTGCGRCVERCPVEALGLVSANDPDAPKKKRAKLDENVCLGCGVCARACPSIQLESRQGRVITPAHSVHRVVRMAIERGRLQHLIFDERALLSHRAMAAILGAILRLPPLQQLMASEQMKSKYLETLLSKVRI